MKEEKRLQFTIEMQIAKATDELLAELIEDGYEGYADIVASIKSKKGQVVVDTKVQKIISPAEPRPKSSMRFHVLPPKAKLIQ